MAQTLPPVALVPDAPGISKKASALAVGSRWIDSDKVRFVDGLPEKIGGWTKKTANTITDPIRGVRAWATMQLLPFIGIGTHRKLYVADQTLIPQDITPIEATGTLTDPFTTTTGSSQVTVNHVNHGRNIGDAVNYPDGSDTLAGITISGAYTIIAVIDEDNYVIEHSAAALIDATGGGSVNYEYELSIGVTDPLEGDGFGAGNYGSGNYGEPSADGSGSIVIEPRIWSLAKYGDLLLCNPVNRGIYVFDPNDTPAYQRAEVLENAPTVCRALFVTPERFVFALGVDNDPMNIKWPDQDDFTNWTPGSTTTANSRRLTEGTRIVGGAGLAQLLSGVWTDNALYQFQYTGSSFIYDSKCVGTNCGLVSPMALVVRLGVAFWMGLTGFFYWSGGTPQPIPNSEDIREYVIRAIRTSGYEFKCNAHYNAKYDEIWWFYTIEGSDEPGLYAMVSLKDFSWAVGSLERTSGTSFEAGDTRPILASSDGWLYQHEDGKDADGDVMKAFITRAPMQIQQGAQLAEVNGFVSDFERQTGTLSVEVTMYERLDDGVLDSERAFFEPNEGLVDLRVGGRIAMVTIHSESASGDFRIGAPTLEVIQRSANRR